VRVGQGLFNRLQHRLTIAEHIVIPEPQHLIPTLHEENRPSLVGPDLRGMMAAIELNHQPVCRPAEIHDVRANGVLPAKLGMMELPITQLPPEYPLTVGLPPAQPSGQSPAPIPLTLPLSPSGGEGSFTPVLHRVCPQEIH
jgi:hypothetical protein